MKAQTAMARTQSSSRWSSRGLSSARSIGLVLALVGIQDFVWAQTSPAGGVTDYNATRYFPAPNFKQMEMKLTGESMMRLSGSEKRLRITKPKFWSFRENGEQLVAIETPECVFDETDAKTRTVSSTEELAMRTGDGRFSIKGKGFLWSQNSKTLIISNDVRALVQWTNNAPPLEITSRWFEFDAERQRGVFHDNVRGEDTNQVFTCEVLAISGAVDKTKRGAVGLSQTNRAAFDLIEADGGLEITGVAKPGYAKAKRGAFHQKEQRVDLVGDAAWKFNGYSGSADEMTVWLSNTNIDAAGKVRLSMPSADLDAVGGLWGATNAPAKTSGTNVVTLFADRFTKRGDQLLADGAVRINDGTNQLTCDKLEGKQATPQSPEEFAHATGNVFVGREGGGIYSERADYSKATGQVLFTGKSRPRFVQGQVSGTAGRVIARPANREVLAEDDVDVTFPLASGSGTLLDFLPTEKTNRVAQASRPNQKVSVTARNFRLQDRLAIFAGNVEAHQLPANGSEPRIRCGELEVKLAADRKHAESLQARKEVVCERGTVGVTNGPAEYARMDSETLTATANPKTGELTDLVAGGGVLFRQTDSEARGEQAVYTRADQVLKLIGQPAIKRPEGTYTSDRELTWDNVQRKVVGSNYRINITGNAETLKQLKESEKLP